MAKMSLTYNDRVPRKNLATLKRRYEIVVTGQMYYGAALGVGYMKTNAPWTDRTAAARASLHTVPSHTPGSDVWEILFAHGVKYGFWLEVAHSRRYQIIMPSVLAIGRQVMRNLDGSLSRVS